MCPLCQLPPPNLAPSIMPTLDPRDLTLRAHNCFSHVPRGGGQGMGPS